MIRTRFGHKGLIGVALVGLSFNALAKGEEQPNSSDNASQPQSTVPTATSTAPDPDPDWHVNLTGYLWFPGTHGLIGQNGHDVYYRASAGDLLSNFRFGLMGFVAAERGRFVILTDLMWVRLAANKQLVTPIPGVPQLTAQPKAWMFILTPEFGYQLFSGEKIKIDAIGGLRYWHVGSSVQFSPSYFGFNFSRSDNWADPVMGARIQVPLSPKIVVTIMGDAGGYGAGSQLDYQIAGAVGLKLSEKWALDAGYRYLYTNYLTSNNRGNFVYQTVMSGAVLGVTYSLK
ncbi:MAG: hypothetical protein JO319_17975 [Acidobacteriaceae bacterium]|nr:hypothetical protein [Acidobacteriaceae bacterium]